MNELGFVYDPENKTIYLTFIDDDPWPLTPAEATKMSLELTKAIKEAYADGTK